MDELFGVADFSHIDDVGLASKQAKGIIEVENIAVAKSKP